MKIVIAGAGGVGSYYGAVLARAGHDVALLARGDHLAALRERGVAARLPDGSDFAVPVRASNEAADLGDAELVLVAVKAFSIPDVAPALALMARSGAVVVPLLNGVDIVDRLAEAGVPRASILAGLTYISAVRTGPGVVERRSDFQVVVVGEPGGGASERAGRVVEAFSGTGVEARVSEAIETELWRKLTFIVTLATACGLARAPIGAVRAAPGGERLLRRAAGEAVAVARAVGAELPETEAEEVVERVLALDGALRPSFLLDLEAGGPTELDVLSATISRLGSEAGVDTPVHDTAWAALSASLEREV
jgi:2-dehydropantoate 2-reductase